MNVYYSEKGNQRGQITTYKKSRKEPSLLYIFLESVFCFLDLVIDFFSKRSVKAVAKVSAISICFFAFLGIIGGIEAGTISLGFGIVLSLFMLFIELLLLRPRH